MNTCDLVCRRPVEITDPLGFHMRRADAFVRVAQQYQSEVLVLHGGKQFNGKSILDLMSMAAECGSRLELEARGSDADATVDALADLIRSRPIVAVVRSPRSS